MEATTIERYVAAAIRNIVGRVEEAQKGNRGQTLLKGSVDLHSLIMSPWVPECLHDSLDAVALLLPAAARCGYTRDVGEAHARRTIANGLRYAKPRPEPAGRPDNVQNRENGAPIEAGDWPEADPGATSAPHSATTGHGESRTGKDRHRSLAGARSAALYGARRAVEKWLHRKGPDELFPPWDQGGTARQGLPHFEVFAGVPLLLEDPRQAPSKEVLLELRLQVEPRTERDYELEQEAAGVRGLKVCGWEMVGACPTHGDMARTRKTCGLSDHSQCPTKETKEIRGLNTLPPAPGGGGHRAVWLGLTFDLPEETGPDEVQGVLERITRATQKVRRRKIGQGLFSKAVSLGMFYGQSGAHVKLLFLEETPGDSDPAVNELCRALGAQVIGEKRQLTPDQAILQLMEDSSHHLFALESPDAALYAAWFFGTRGARLFESYGVLRKLLERQRWPAKGEVTIPAGATQAVIDLPLAEAVNGTAGRCPATPVVEIKPAGSVGRPWGDKGVVSAEGKVREWKLDQVGDETIIKFDGPAPAAFSFRVRAQEDHTPTCDICGARLEWTLIPPANPDVGGGDGSPTNGDDILVI
jgi:hypothetical protein